MRALVLGPEEKAKIAELVAYAYHPDHWYKPNAGWVPGDNPHFVVHIPHGFRCVFTITMNKMKRYRHLTVSVDGPNLPSPEAMVMLAEAFGFTSSSKDLNISKRIENDGWMVASGHDGEHCIVAAQEVHDGPGT